MTSVWLLGAGLYLGISIADVPGMEKIIQLSVLALVFGLAAQAPAQTREETQKLIDLAQAFHAEMREARSLTQETLRERFKTLEFHGVELVIAAPTKAHIESRRGHSLFRFVDTDADPLNDMILSFTAETGGDEGFRKIRRGGAGRYPAKIEFLTIRHLLDGYVRSEDRALSRYVMPTTEATRTRFHKYVLDRLQHPEKLGNYGIFWNNCAQLLTDFLGETGASGEKKEIMFPIDIPKFLRERQINPYPELVAPTLASAREKQFQNLNAREAFRLLVEAPALKTGDLEMIAKTGAGEISAVEGYRLESLTPDVYRACSSRECAEAVIAAGARIWGPKKFKDQVAWTALSSADSKKVSSEAKEHISALRGVLMSPK